MRRLGVALGAHSETFSGLSGLGDLTVTCFSRMSRNRTFGERLGRGEKLERIFAAEHELVEGYPTSRSAYQIASRLKSDAPVLTEIHATLYEGKNVARAIGDLLSRDLKSED